MPGTEVVRHSPELRLIESDTRNVAISHSAASPELIDNSNLATSKEVPFQLAHQGPASDLAFLDAVLSQRSSKPFGVEGEVIVPGRSVAPGPSTPRIIVYGGNTALDEVDEQGAGKPGWYLPVNWGDVDGDGWSPAGVSPPTANSGPVYAGDKFDQYVPGPVPGYTGGDPALFKFEVSAWLVPLAPMPDGDVKLTFDTSKIKVWKTNTKKVGDSSSASSEVTSGTLFNYQNDIFPTGKVTLYAEGIAGSASFKDAFLKAELIPESVVRAQPAGDPDDVQVTTFEITNAGRYTGGRSGDNDGAFRNSPTQVTRCLEK